MQRVDFIVIGGEVVSTTSDIVRRNCVLNMLWQHQQASDGPPKPIVLNDDYRNTLEVLLRHLAGEPVDLGNRGLTDLIMLFTCAHRYQCYSLGSDIIQQLDRYHSPENVLHIYRLLQRLPELPATEDPWAPSAPPESEPRHTDPERDSFASLLQATFRRCLEVIDSRSVEVLNSDALLSLPLDQLQELAQGDTLQARELDIGRGLLRWLRHHSLNSPLPAETPRQLVLGSLRLLTMPPKELKKLELERVGVLTREELEEVLRYAHHGSGALPPQLEAYQEYWLYPRAGRRGAGVLRRLVERTRAAGYGGQDVTDLAERREAAIQKRNRRADKVKMALATGAAFLFD